MGINRLEMLNSAHQKLSAVPQTKRQTNQFSHTQNQNTTPYIRDDLKALELHLDEHCRKCGKKFIVLSKKFAGFSSINGEEEFYYEIGCPTQKETIKRLLSIFSFSQHTTETYHVCSPRELLTGKIHQSVLRTIRW